jgi:hypothetical protein
LLPTGNDTPGPIQALYSYLHTKSTHPFTSPPQPINQSKYPFPEIPGLGKKPDFSPEKNVEKMMKNFFVFHLALSKSQTA